MNTLVLGSGAREHALVWALARECGFADRLFCAPGNAGTESLAKNIALDPENPKAVLEAVRELNIDFVIVGPEGPLAAGVVDLLAAAGVLVFGPASSPARLESSKAFARSFSDKYGIPSARTQRLSDAASLKSYLSEMRGSRIVLKKSGLAAGKGVLESDDSEELLAYGEEILRSDTLLAEEFLVGRELSVFGISDGRGYTLLPACTDHKKAGVGDTGPNTGGMGAVCPVPYATEAAMREIEDAIIAPSYEGMAREGLSYKGVLFFGIMLTAGGPKLLEYNVRFGDPETESLLPLLESGIGDLCFRAASGNLAGYRPAFSGKFACGVVIAAPGYPGSYPKALEARLPDLADSEEDYCLFHASTRRDDAGRIRTGGGRCFSAVGLGRDWPQAKARAYEIAKEVRFDGAWFRPDIGDRIFTNSR